jgi:hypothetical protein
MAGDCWSEFQGKRGCLCMTDLRTRYLYVIERLKDAWLAGRWPRVFRPHLTISDFSAGVGAHLTISGPVSNSHRSNMPSCRITNYTSQPLNVSLKHLCALHFENEVAPGQTVKLKPGRVWFTLEYVHVFRISLVSNCLMKSSCGRQG